MEIDLTGRTAVVTGSASSTTDAGYTMARALARAGASVVITGRDQDRVEEALARLEQEVRGAEATGVAADLSTAEGVARLTAAIPKADILVHNAGLPDPRPFMELTDEDWEHHFQLHVMAAVRLARQYIPAMVEEGWGRILLSASTTSGFLNGEMVHYGTTKTALLGLSRGLAESVPGSGVTVNAFLPGPMRVRTAEIVEQEEAIFSQLPTSLIERFIAPEEVADLVVFLASDHASAITGAAFRIDGGIVRSIL